jgi:hypothetical protein
MCWHSTGHCDGLLLLLLLHGTGTCKQPGWEECRLPLNSSGLLLGCTTATAWS